MIINRCRYCGLNYEFTDFYDDPKYCGQKKCRASMEADSFQTEHTEAGDSAIQPVTFKGRRSTKVVRSTEVTKSGPVKVSTKKKTAKKKTAKKKTKKRRNIVAKVNLNDFPEGGTEIKLVDIDDPKKES
jgi:hypothetical protein